MSERDILDEAFSAVREETAETVRDSLAMADVTRQSLLRRRLGALRLALPIAALLAATAAWAAASGGLARVVPGFGDRVWESHREREPVVAASASAAKRTALEDEPKSKEELRVVTSEPPPAAPNASVARSADSPDREEALYRSAHELHFVQRDPARALVAWDAYLARHPNGRFAPEARYNRALMLIRLGRQEEAKEALRPFADGPAGAYRQAEAKQLIDAMD
jgi:TolA-binding protein